MLIPSNSGLIGVVDSWGRQFYEYMYFTISVHLQSRLQVRNVCEADHGKGKKICIEIAMYMYE